MQRKGMLCYNLLVLQLRKPESKMEIETIGR